VEDTWVSCRCSACALPMTSSPRCARSSGASETVHLAGEDPIEVSVEAVVVTPEKIELSVVSLDHFIQQDPFHGAIVASEPREVALDCGARLSASPCVCQACLRRHGRFPTGQCFPKVGLRHGGVRRFFPPWRSAWCGWRRGLWKPLAVAAAWF